MILSSKTYQSCADRWARMPNRSVSYKKRADEWIYVVHKICDYNIGRNIMVEILDDSWVLISKLFRVVLFCSLKSTVSLLTQQQFLLHGDILKYHICAWCLWCLWCFDISFQKNTCAWYEICQLLSWVIHPQTHTDTPTNAHTHTHTHTHTHKHTQAHTEVREYGSKPKRHESLSRPH